MADPQQRNRESADPHRRWLGNNPGELPIEVEEEAQLMGADLSDPLMQAAVRDLLEMDPDLFGDFDAYQ